MFLFTDFARRNPGRLTGGACADGRIDDRNDFLTIRRVDSYIQHNGMKGSP